MTQLLFFTIPSLYLGLSFFHPRGITRALKVLSVFLQRGIPHFSMALGMGTGAPSRPRADKDATGIVLNGTGQELSASKR